MLKQDIEPKPQDGRRLDNRVASLERLHQALKTMIDKHQDLLLTKMMPPVPDQLAAVDDDAKWEAVRSHLELAAGEKVRWQERSSLNSQWLFGTVFMREGINQSGTTTVELGSHHHEVPTNELFRLAPIKQGLVPRVDPTDEEQLRVVRKELAVRPKRDELNGFSTYHVWAKRILTALQSHLEENP